MGVVKQEQEEKGQNKEGFNIRRKEQEEKHKNKREGQKRPDHTKILEKRDERFEEIQKQIKHIKKDYKHTKKTLEQIQAQTKKRTPGKWQPKSQDGDGDDGKNVKIFRGSAV